MTISLTAAALAVAGCGSEERQDANEPAGTFTVDITTASFPAKQQIAAPSKMKIDVKNTGEQTIPNVAVTVDSFTRRSEQPGLADPERPVWVVDEGPVGGDTAFTNTWALNALKAGETKSFEWDVTPIEPGRYTIKYTVAAGLDGKAKAVEAGGGPVTGTFPVQISKTPEQSRVDPATGEVQRLEEK
ncbi:MAG: hypothetical protein H0V81_11970 [Solirubrobacterales bacterium]|nr:hypothetical protein [Solirubrobacterales bacterium]